MADVVWLEFPSGMDAETYDKINDRINPPGNPPDGLIFHTAGPSPDGGWRIIDVWESRAMFDRFLGEKIGPTVAEVVGEGAEDGAPKIVSWPEYKHTIA
jgi:hypothetical protein